MVKRVGLFSDLHGDKQNLDLIVRSLKKLGIDQTLFLGDALYKTMTDFSNTTYAQANQFRSALRQDSQIRRDVMDGLFSDDQLEQIINGEEFGKNVGKKVARLEYQDFKSALEGLDYAVLGGNWDYREEMQEVFGDSLLNSTYKEFSGLRALGFIGGGSPTIKTAMTETFADNEDEQGLMYQQWTQKLASQEPLNVDMLISHVPFTDGEGVKKENCIEHLKNLVLRRKEAGLDAPEVLINGHRHGGAAVKYDEEMGSYLVTPGSCSRNHNGVTPMFLVAEFDDNNKLTGAKQYSIFASAIGASEVRLSGEYTIDRENKKVDFEEKNEVLVQEYDQKTFTNHLSVDSNFGLTQAGLNLGYDSFREDPKELDLIVRKNIQCWFNETEKVSEDLKEMFSGVAKRYISEAQGNIEEAIANAEEELAKLVCKKSGADYEALSQNPLGKHIIRTMATTLLGVDYSVFFNSLRENQLNSLSDASSWGNDVVESSNSNLSKHYQNEIFQDLESEDLQAMAECHMPAAYERTKELEKSKAFNLWVSTFKQGFLTSDAVEATNAYQKKESYVANKRTKEDIANKFDLATEELTDEVPKEINNVSDLPKEEQKEIKELLKDENQTVPVIKDEEGKDYLLKTNGQRMYLGDDFRNELEEEGIGYSTMTAEEFQQNQARQIANSVRDGRLPIIKGEDGQEYIPGPNRQLQRFNPQQFGLNGDDYQSQSMQELMGPRTSPTITNPTNEL